MSVFHTKKSLSFLFHLSSPYSLCKRRRGPVNVLRNIRRGALLDPGGTGRSIEQEPVDERSEVSLLVGGERAMSVVAGACETHVIGDTSRLVNHAGRLHASRGGDGTKPVNLVLDDEQTTRGDETGQLVVIGRERLGVGGERVECRTEPDVLGDDLGSRLDVLSSSLLRVGDTPARGTTGATLLREAESNTRHEGRRCQGSLAVPGASSDTELLGVDTRVDELESVDDTIDTPCPGSQRTSAVSRPVQIEEFALSTAAPVRLLANRAVVEGDGGNIGRDWDTSSAIGDDSWEGTSSAGLLDRDRERDRFSAFGGSDGQRRARERRGDGAGFGCLPW